MSDVTSLLQKIEKLERNNQMSLKMISKLKRKEKENQKAMIKNCRSIVEKNEISMKSRIGKLKEKQKKKAMQMQQLIMTKDKNWKEKITNLRNQVAELSKKLEDSMNNNNNNNNNNSSGSSSNSNEDFEGLKEKNESLQSQLEEMQNSLGSIQSDHEEISSKYEKSKISLKNLTNQISDLENKNSSLSLHLEKLKNENLKYESSESSLISEKKNLLSEIEKYKLELKNSSSTKLSLSEKTEEFENMMNQKTEEFETTVNTMKLETEKMQNKLRSLESEKASLELQILAKSSEITEKQETINTLKEKEEENFMKLRNLNKELETIKFEKESVVAKNEILQDSFEELKNSNSSNSAETQEEIVNLQNSLTSYKLDNQKLSSKIKDIENTLEQLEIAKKKLENSLVEKHEEFEFFKNQNTPKIETNKILENTIEELRNKSGVNTSEYELKITNFENLLIQKDKEIKVTKEKLVFNELKFNEDLLNLKKSISMDHEKQITELQENFEIWKKKELSELLKSENEKIMDSKSTEIQVLETKILKLENDNSQNIVKIRQEEELKTSEALSLQKKDYELEISEKNKEINEIEKQRIIQKSEYESKINDIHKSHHLKITSTEKKMHRKFHDRFKERRTKYFSGVQKQMMSMKKKYMSLYDQKETLISEKKENQELINSLNLKIKRIEEDMKNEKLNFTSLQKDYQKISESSVNDLENNISKISELKNKNFELEEELKGLKKKLSNFENQESENTNELFKKQRKQLDKKNEKIEELLNIISDLKIKELEHKKKMKEKKEKKMMKKIDKLNKRKLGKHNNNNNNNETLNYDKNKYIPPSLNRKVSVPQRMSATLKPSSKNSDEFRKLRKLNEDAARRKKKISISLSDDEEYNSREIDNNNLTPASEIRKNKNTKDEEEEKEVIIEKEIKIEEQNLTDEKTKKERRKTISMDDMNINKSSKKKIQNSAISKNPGFSTMRPNTSSRKNTVSGISRKSPFDKDVKEMNKAKRKTINFTTSKNSKLLSNTLGGIDSKRLKEVQNQLFKNSRRKKSKLLNEVFKEEEEEEDEIENIVIPEIDLNYKNIGEDEIKKIQKEYDSINNKFSKMNSRHFNISAAHHFKNRSASRNLPLNHSLVELKKNRYICASKFSLSNNSYILTQWPIKNEALDTSHDFWRMVVTVRPSPRVIAILFPPKAPQYPVYWPTEENKVIDWGKLKVRFVSFEKHDDFDIYNIAAWKEGLYFGKKKKKKFGGFLKKKKKKKKNEEQRVLGQRDVAIIIYKKKWNLKTIPSEIGSFSNFLYKVEEIQQTRKIPKEEECDESERSMIVHAGIGVGRTGSFALVHSILCSGKEEKDSSRIKENLTIMRKNGRVGLVENFQQYSWIYSYIKDIKDE